MQKGLTQRYELIGHLSVGIAFAIVAALMPWSIFIESALASYFALLADSFLRHHQPTEREENFCIGSLLFVFPVLVLPVATLCEVTLRPRVFDTALRAADLRLHLDGFALSRFCFGHSVAHWIVGFVYAILPVVQALAWIAGRSKTFLRGCLFCGLSALPLYMLCPAVGPHWAFAGWPRPDAHFDAAGSAGYPRNCMPSMHTAWALLCALNVRGWRRIPFILYAVLMMLSTVAVGEHYFIDALAAVPFTLIVQRVAAINWTRQPQLVAQLPQP